MRRRLICLPLLAALAVAGCGSDLEPGAADQALDAGRTETRAGAAATTTAAAPTPVPASRTGEVSTDVDAKPRVPKPSGAAPTRLEVRDVVEGEGPAAATGDTLDVRYVGVLFANAREFDSSWSRGRDPFSFTVGQGVIEGWSQGVVGMRAGGRRELIIPAALAYGEQGQGDIPANAPLVFVIDLVRIGS